MVVCQLSLTSTHAHARAIASRWRLNPEKNRLNAEVDSKKSKARPGAARAAKTRAGKTRCPRAGRAWLRRRRRRRQPRRARPRSAPLCASLRGQQAIHHAQPAVGRGPRLSPSCPLPHLGQVWYPPSRPCIHAHGQFGYLCPRPACRQIGTIAASMAASPTVTQAGGGEGDAAAGAAERALSQLGAAARPGVVSGLPEHFCHR